MLVEKFKEIYRYRSNLWTIANFNLKDRYAGSLLGLAWAVVVPCLLMLSVTVVFRYVFRIEIKNFELFVFSGLFPWMFTSSALFDSATSLVSQRNILRQFAVPRIVVPLASALTNFLNYIFGFLLVYPIFLIVNPGIIELFPVFIFTIVTHFIFVCGLGLLLSVINAFYRGLTHVLGVILIIWLWATPVFYDPLMVPVEFRWVIYCNPMNLYISAYRDVLFFGRLPQPNLLAVMIIFSFIVFVSGLFVLSKNERKILKKI